MKIPSEVVWQLTKRWNSSIVKFNGQSFSSDPLNLTNFHNAASAGSNDHAVGISAVKEQGKKGTKRVFTIIQAHKTHNKVAKAKKNTKSGAYVSKTELRRGSRRIAKAVNGLNGVNDRTKRIALKRLQKLHAATRPIVKGAAAKKEEKK